MATIILYENKQGNIKDHAIASILSEKTFKQVVISDFPPDYLILIPTEIMIPFPINLAGFCHIFNQPNIVIWAGHGNEKGPEAFFGTTGVNTFAGFVRIFNPFKLVFTSCKVYDWVIKNIGMFQHLLPTVHYIDASFEEINFKALPAMVKSVISNPPNTNLFNGETVNDVSDILEIERIYSRALRSLTNKKMRSNKNKKRELKREITAEYITDKRSLLLKDRRERELAMMNERSRQKKEDEAKKLEEEESRRGRVNPKPASRFKRTGLMLLNPPK